MLYTTTMQSVSMGVAKDLIRITAGAQPFTVTKVNLGSDNIEVAGRLLLGLYRASTLGTGTATTPVPLDERAGAFDGTAVTDLSVDTTTAARPLEAPVLDVAATWPGWDTGIFVGPGHTFVLRLDTTPTVVTIVSGATASGGSFTTTENSGASYGTTAHVGEFVVVTAGTNAGLRRKITSHTNTILTHDAFPAAQDGTSQFTVSAGPILTCSVTVQQ